jgi:mono/diheme cytochrome c family protein
MKIHTLTLLAAAAVATLSLGAGAFAQVAGDAANPASSSAPTVKPGDADGAFVVGAKFSEPNGEKMYRRVCAACHMPDAKGAVGGGAYPALAANPNLAAAGYPVSVVLQGLNGMPPLGGMMSDQQVADVVNYIRTHFGNKYKDAVKAADVKEARQPG